MDYSAKLDGAAAHRAKSKIGRIRDARRQLISWEAAATVEAAPEMNVPVIVGGMFWEPVQSNYALKARHEPESRRFYLQKASFVQKMASRWVFR